MPSPPEIELTALPWDSAHFGFGVARIPTVVTDDQLRRALERARQEQVRLVYWPATHDRPVLPGLLEEFRGARLDLKATYVAEPMPRPAEREPSSGVRITDAPSGEPSAALVRLAIEAGGMSRFRRDPRIPVERFEALYRTWMERSTRREIADLVLQVETDGGEILGVMTASVEHTTARVGLVAVAQHARGRGLGVQLLDALHRRSPAPGRDRVEVVTQLDNRPACALYERAGYQLFEILDVYHFWPSLP